MNSTDQNEIDQRRHLAECLRREGEAQLLEADMLESKTQVLLETGQLEEEE